MLQDSFPKNPVCPKVSQVDQSDIKIRNMLQQLEGIVPGSAPNIKDMAGVRRRGRCRLSDQCHRQRRIDSGRLAGFEVGEPLYVGVESLPDFIDRRFHRFHLVSPCVAGLLFRDPPTTLHGFPAANTPSWMILVTTLLAPMTEFEPIRSGHGDSGSPCNAFCIRSRTPSSGSHPAARSSDLSSPLDHSPRDHPASAATAMFRFLTTGLFNPASISVAPRPGKRLSS